MADCSNCKGDRIQYGICLDCGYRLETTRAPSKPETTAAPRPRKRRT